MKKFRTVCLVLALCMTLLSTAFLFVGCQSYDETLIVYNWEDYIYNKQELQNDFNEYYYNKTGKTIQVKYSTFDTNETMLTKMINSNTVADIICPSEYAIQKLLANGLIQKIDKSSISTINNVNPEIYQKVSSVYSDFTVNGQSVNINDYFVPYMMGTLGILYNADVVTQADLDCGWGLLWNKNNNPDLMGKIYMKDSIRDSYVAAILYLVEENRLPTGYETKSVQELINDTSDPIIEAVETVLKEQKESGCLKGYEVDFGKLAMINEGVHVDLAWSGDAMYAIEEAAAIGINLDYFVPESGGNIWFDGWVIPTTAQNVPAAHAMIEFLNRPDIATKNMVEIGYTSAVDKNVLMADQEVATILQEAEYDFDEFFADEVRYPDYSDTTLGVMKDFGEKNTAITTMWESMLGSDIDLTIVWVLLGVFAVVIIIVLVISLNKKKKVRYKR